MALLHGHPLLKSRYLHAPRVAQLLCVASERAITRLLENLFSEAHHQPHNYYWFVAVALQRIHGVSIDIRRKATAILVHRWKGEIMAARDATPEREAIRQMTPEERFDRIERNLEKLAMLAASTAASVIAHDEQIDKLVKVAQTQQQQWASLTEELQGLRREFQAYLTTIHPRQ